MKTSVKHVVLFLPLLLALAGGCATTAVWKEGTFESCNEPAGNLNLRLFQTSPQTNLLVIYDEFSERNQAVRTRAYWLNENQGLVDQHLRPHFTSTDSMRNLPAVPIFYEPIPARVNLPPTLCAVVATNKESFTLFLANRAVGSHDLPVYNDGKGQVERIAITPVAVTADLTIVGGYLGCWYLLGRAGYSGPSY
jgi:hypothetical protein